MTVVRLTDFADIVCAPATTVRQAMARMTETGTLFQVVADRHGRVLGTVTDGDLRRAILSGVAVDEPIAKTMRREPVIGHLHQPDQNRILLDGLHRSSPHAAFLPVVDEAGKLREIFVFADAEREPPAALIMAGGLGRRLGERTREVPKPLLSVGGKPIVERIIARLEETQVRRIYIAVHYLADKFQAFLHEYQGRADVRLIVEERPFGTAGAIRLIPERPAEPFLIVNADVVTEVDFTAMRAFHERHENDGTVATAQYEHVIPYGVVLHTEDGQLRSIEEKPVIRYNVAAGIYYLSPEFCDLVPDDEAIDMPALLMRARQSGLRIGLFPVHEYWRDIGRPADLEAANHENQTMTGTTGRRRQS